MKYLIPLLYLIILASSVRAQSNQTEARAAYMLAEESYSKKDYKASLDFLNQVKSNLGSSNCKILYLEIMVTRELYPNLAEGGEKLLTLINEFEKSPDYADFTEEKVLEIAKLKLSLKADMKVLKDKTDKENAEAQAKENAFNSIFNARGPWNVTKDGLDAAMPSLKVKEWKQVEKYSTVAAPGINWNPKPAKGKYNWSIDPGVNYQGNIATVSFQKDSVYAYQTFLVYNMDHTEETTAQWSKAYNLVKEYTATLGPFVANTSYEWKRGKNRIVLQLLYTNGKKPGDTISVMLIETLYAY